MCSKFLECFHESNYGPTQVIQFGLEHLITSEKSVHTFQGIEKVVIFIPGLFV